MHIHTFCNKNILNESINYLFFPRLISAFVFYGTQLYFAAIQVICRYVLIFSMRKIVYNCVSDGLRFLYLERGCRAFT